MRANTIIAALLALVFGVQMASANITWKILKNKARLGLEFEDILNNEDGFWSDQTAYQHSSTWQDFHHHYVGISFTYHLDAKKKD